ncbi:DUF2164 family protein [Candidatus Peregrinibacteria bacterium]|nr:DUF2164 family protein [Candidatus Peregrinibacteria bacterium]
MKEMKRKLDRLLTTEQRQSSINEIIAFLKKEHDLELGHIGAEDILDLFLQKTGEEVYKKGVQDAKNLVKNRFEDLEVDLSLL